VNSDECLDHFAVTAGVWEYIKDVLDTVHSLEKRLQKSKDNVEQIQKLMSSWSKTPLFERMEGKHTTLLNLTDREDRLRKRYEDITQAGVKIHTLIQVVELVSFKNKWLCYCRGTARGTCQ